MSAEHGLLQDLVSLLLQTRTPIGPMRDRKDYPAELQRAIDFLHGRGSPSAELGRSEPTSRVDAMLKRQEAQRRDSKVADFVELRRMHEQETVLLLYALERENNEHLRQRAAGNAARPHSDGKRTVSQPSTQQSAITERSK